MKAQPTTRDKRHKRRSLALSALLTLSILATAGFLLDREWTAYPRELERWWLLVVARAADGSTRVSLGGHSHVSQDIAWPELAEGEYVALVINGWSSERCPRPASWLVDGLQVEHATSYRPHRLSRAAMDDPTLAFGVPERTAAAALLSPILDDFTIKPAIITQGARVRRSHVPRIVLRAAIAAVIILPFCAAAFVCALIIRDWLREQFDLCPRCGYGLKGLPENAFACPECGDDLAAMAGRGS